MKLQLFVSRSFEPCRNAEHTWKSIADEHGIELAIIEIDGEVGRVLAEALGIRFVPAVVMDGRLAAVGVQTPQEVRSLLAAGSSHR